METVKFSDPNGRVFFECRPAEARIAIDAVRKYRERKPTSDSTSDVYGLAEELGAHVIPCDHPMNGKRGYLLFKEVGNKERTWLVESQFYKVTGIVRGVEEYVKILQRALKNSDLLLMEADNPKALQVGVIHIKRGGIGTFYTCGVLELQSYLKVQGITSEKFEELRELARENATMPAIPQGEPKDIVNLVCGPEEYFLALQRAMKNNLSIKSADNPLSLQFGAIIIENGKGTEYLCWVEELKEYMKEKHIDQETLDQLRSQYTDIKTFDRKAADIFNTMKEIAGEE